jgi:hypothetical protein
VGDDRDVAKVLARLVRRGLHGVFKKIGNARVERGRAKPGIIGRKSLATPGKF